MGARRTGLVLALAAILGASCAGSGADPPAAAPAGTASPSTTLWVPPSVPASVPDPTVIDTSTTAPAPPSPTVPAAGDVSVLPGEEPEDDRVVRSSRHSDDDVDPSGHIEIPAIGLSHPTYEGIEMDMIDRGPSHWPGTALAGERGNTVYPGHRTTHSRPFYDIDRLVPGDHVILTVASGTYVYEVRETFVVDDRDTWIVDQTPDPTFTIFACHPKGSARQRYVVKGVLISAPAPTPPPPPTTTTTTEPRDEALLTDLLG